MRGDNNWCAQQNYRDTVTGGSVLASGAQPPASATQKIPVVFGGKFYRYSRTAGQSQVCRQHTALKCLLLHALYGKRVKGPLVG